MSQIPFLTGTAAATGILDTQNYQFVTITCPNLSAQTAAPSISSTSTDDTGGVLAALTTYGYKITRVTPAGETTPSAEATQLTGVTATNTVTINFTAAATGTTTNIYGRTSGGPWGLIGTVAAGITSFVDDGSVTPGAAPPGANTTAESVTVKLNVPDGQTAPSVLDVNGNAATFANPSATHVLFGGPSYVITTTGTISGAGVYVDFGGRVQ